MSDPLSRIFARIGQAQLARCLGISPQAISQWRSVPVRRVIEVERLTGVPRHELRADIYPPPRRAKTGRTGAAA